MREGSFYHSLPLFLSDFVPDPDTERRAHDDRRAELPGEPRCGTVSAVVGSR